MPRHSVAAALPRHVCRHLFVLLALFSAPATIAHHSTIQVITHPDTPANELSVATLRGIFSMRVRRWPADGPVWVFVLPDRDNSHAAFTRELLRVYPYVLRDTWDRLVFTGTGTAPIEVKDPHELAERVASTPGAIGYLPTGKPVSEDIKVLAIR